MKSMVATFSLIVTTFTFVSSYADGSNTSQVQSAADKLYSNSFTMTRQLGISHGTDVQSCKSNDTAVVTIYSTNGQAQNEIDVKLDGSPVGSLTTYFPSNGPGCKAPSAKGVITIMIPAGSHTLEADSPNVSWPSHNFSVEKCECVVLPLS